MNLTSDITNKYGFLQTVDEDGTPVCSQCQCCTHDNSGQGTMCQRCINEDFMACEADYYHRSQPLLPALEVGMPIPADYLAYAFKPIDYGWDNRGIYYAPVNPNEHEAFLSCLMMDNFGELVMADPFYHGWAEEQHVIF